MKKAYKILQTHENQIINFKDYGANSSRTRSVTIGVRRDLIDKVHPLDLFPDKEEPKTLIEVIGNLFSLNEWEKLILLTYIIILSPIEKI